MKAIRFIAWILAWFGAFVCAAWATGALYFDFPILTLRAPVAIMFLIVLFVSVIFIPGKLRRLVAALGGFALVLGWWLTLKPSNNRPWPPDVAQTAWAEINGDKVTIHNVRNCDYRTEADYTPHWETRTVRISQIAGIDLAVNYWGSPWIAHPILSFQFADAPPICFSIETRKKLGQTYSTIGGLYRQFELIYIVADERDVIRVRTNYRKGEDIYLYRTTISPVDARERFLEYIRSLNALRDKARWYNAITTNCTTSIRTQHVATERMPWDWRILVNGKGDELLYERGVLDQSVPFAELKRRAYINARARAANDAPDFSERIRTHVVGAVPSR
ncbi:MAG TPA: DUF4105 domain-containing protein [Chthoniobacterales bacterium]|nr:DUF4105 domain-containing protein [Chthoniobacterales bacterium]